MSKVYVQKYPSSILQKVELKLEIVILWYLGISKNLNDFHELEILKKFTITKNNILTTILGIKSRVAVLTNELTTRMSTEIRQKRKGIFSPCLHEKYIGYGVILREINNEYYLSTLLRIMLSIVFSF